MRPVLATMLLVGLAGCGGGSAPVASDGAAGVGDTVVAAGDSLSSDADSVDPDPPMTAPPSESAPTAAPAPTETSTPLATAIEPPTTEPPVTFVPPEAESVAQGLGAVTYDLPACPDTARGAVTDKANQRYWLCMNGEAVTDEIPMTTASSNYGLPPVGTYAVFARDEDAFGISGEALERFVAFYTTPKGNRIAFHEVVNQDPATVGDLDQRGASAGCFRVREADSIQVWDFLQIGDPVVVLTN